MFKFISIFPEDAVRLYKLNDERSAGVLGKDLTEIQHGQFSDLCFWNGGAWQYLTTRKLPKNKNFSFQVRYRTSATASKTAYSFLWVENVNDLEEAWRVANEQVKGIPEGHLGFVLEGLHDGLKYCGDGIDVKEGEWRNKHNQKKRVKMNLT